MSTFEDSFDRLFASAYRVAFAIIGERTESEDLAQEALARALVRWDRLAGHEEAWVVRAASNLALDRARAAGRRRRGTHMDPGVDGPSGERVDLQRALAALPRRQREVVVLRFLGGLTGDQVAGALGCSPGAVKQHSSRGIAALRRHMGQEGSDAPAPA